MEQIARQLLQEDVGQIGPCAAPMHVSESGVGRESSESGGLAVGGKVEENDDAGRRRREDSRSAENVGVARNVP